MTDPIIKPTDDEGAAAAHGWESQDAARLLGWLTESIGESVELLKELPDASWGRPGQHPEDGRRSIHQHVVAMAAHCAEHIAGLEGARR